MVGLRQRRARPRDRGKLTRDRGIETAAVALLHGFDPIPFLALDPDDFRVAIAVLNRAQQMRADHEKALADYVSARTAGLTAQAITRWFSRAFHQMFKN